MDEHQVKDVYPSLEEKVNGEGGPAGDPPKAEVDETQVRFLPNGDDKEAEVKLSYESGSALLTKQELMRFADDPFWVRIRWTALVLFVFVWLAMLVGAIVIVALTPGCAVDQRRDKLRSAVVFQLRSDQLTDSNEDGAPDLASYKEKLPTVAAMGVRFLWLSGMQESADQEDLGKFGKMADLKQFVDEAHKNKLEVMMEFVAGHVKADKNSPWFDAVLNLTDDDAYKDYVVTSESPGPLQGAAKYSWKPVGEGLHVLEHQALGAKVNLRDEAARKAVGANIAKWLGTGLDGLVLRDDLSSLIMDHDVDQEKTGAAENGKLLKEWRTLFKKKNSLMLSVIDEPGEDDDGAFVNSTATLVESTQMVPVVKACVGTDASCQSRRRWITADFSVVWQAPENPTPLNDVGAKVFAALLPGAFVADINDETTTEEAQDLWKHVAKFKNDVASHEVAIDVPKKLAAQSAYGFSLLAGDGMSYYVVANPTRSDIKVQDLAVAHAHVHFTSDGSVVPPELAPTNTTLVIEVPRQGVAVVAFKPQENAEAAESESDDSGGV